MKKKSYILGFIVFLFCILIGSGVFYLYYYQPLVSVVMPVYNREKLVTRAINSILNQTYRNIELIIVDDGSTDSTPTILNYYKQKDPRIKILTNQLNKGISYSRQRGLDTAMGKYVAIMDSDDWALPERIEKSVAFMKEHPYIDAMCGQVIPFSEEEAMSHYIQNYRFDKSKAKEYTAFGLDGWYEIDLVFDNLFQNIASLFKRDFVQKNHIHYDLTMTSAEDYDFWSQIALAGGRMASVLDVLGYSRMHSTNSYSYYQDMNNNSKKIRHKMMKYFFEPTPQEIKIAYTPLERCNILKKIVQKNKEHPLIRQKWLEHHYDVSCPKNIEKTIFLSHTYWKDFLEHIDGNRYKRHKSTDFATVMRSKDGHKIRVIWDNWPSEEFIQQKNKIYYYHSEKEIPIKLKHPNWSCTILLDPNTSKGCKIDKPSECATITFTENDTIILNWEKTPYLSEEFYRGVINLWIFQGVVSKKTK